VKPAPFLYYRATTPEEAVALLGELGDDAKVIAGGQSLVAMMNLRLARPTALVDVNRIPGLAYVLDTPAALRVGALARHRQLEQYPAPLPGLAVLPRAARLVGHYPIRVRGTIGGSIAHADPTAEWCLMAVLLDAEVVALGPRGVRTVPASELFIGPFQTVLAPDEMLVEVRFPRRYDHAAVDEVSRRHGDFAIVAAAAAYDRGASGQITSARVALGGVAGTAVRVEEAERLLMGERPHPDLFAEAGRVAASVIDPTPDAHGDVEFRRDLARALVQRTLTAAEALR
jgi:aerobic carbon-monoxide dehydrogenase medium subunit